jgi:hypothetical protein
VTTNLATRYGALPALAAELERRAESKRDYVAAAQSLMVRSNGRSLLSLDDEEFELNAVAHGQLAEWTGVPKTFYDRLRSQAEQLTVDVWHGGESAGPATTPLFDVLLNRLISSRTEDRRLVRTLDGTCRAVLSDSFNPDLDNVDVYRIAAKSIDDQGLGAEHMVSAEVTERKLYIKVVSPRLEAIIRPENLERPHGGHHFLREPEVVQAGVLISNSEVGLGSLSVQSFVYKLQCTNGWIVETPYRQRHVGKALEAGDDRTVCRSDTRLADARPRLLKVRDHVAEALDEHRFLATVAKMQASAGLRLEGGVEKVVEAAARKFALNQNEKEDVLRNLIEGADLSYWGLMNATTAAAHTAASYDRAVELEVLGGRMLALPAAEAKQLAKAA